MQKKVYSNKQTNFSRFWIILLNLSDSVFTAWCDVLKELLHFSLPVLLLSIEFLVGSSLTIVDFLLPINGDLSS